MKIHIIGTVNGIENEGMRNVATHLTREFSKIHTVSCSGLKQVAGTLTGCMKADVTLIFARANKLIYWLTRMVEKLCKRVYIVCVQKPDGAFLHLNARRPLRCGYFAISPGDIADLESVSKHCFPVGIKTEKFTPVKAQKAAELKAKYGFDPEKPLIVHVGHCSSGRGLEDLLAIDGEQYQRFVVASGMFEDADVVQRLEQNGVRIHRGYLEHVEEVYQMADAYLFPTRSSEYVISIPLSVMEALSCGTPVIGYRSFANLNDISAAAEGITLINDASELSSVLREVIEKKQDRSMLTDARTWADSAGTVLSVIKEEIR